jgi:molybdenum cofactor biosynthesis protein B
MSYDQHIQNASGIIARCAIITLSDTRTADTDKSGARVRELLQSAGHHVAEYSIIRDEPAALIALIDQYASRSDIDSILTNGGTGISRRDQTIDALQKRLDRILPGFGELFRMLSFQQIGSGAMLSRAIAGTIGSKVVFAMPGSSKAVEVAMEQLIVPQMKHLISELRK